MTPTGASGPAGPARQASPAPGPPTLQVCLNGTRRAPPGSPVPVTPAEVAAAAAEAVAQGATCVHVHPRDDDGRETFRDGPVSATIDALRAQVDVPIGVTTGAWTLPDPDERVRLIERWSVLPDFASVNVHEPGAARVGAVLAGRGIGIEAGVWTTAAARALVDLDLAGTCLRLLVEPMAETVAEAVATIDVVTAVLDEAALAAPRLVHGRNRTAWPVLDLAVGRGFDVRIGFEDTRRGPDGRPAASNAELVALAVRRLGWGPVPGP